MDAPIINTQIGENQRFCCSGPTSIALMLRKPQTVTAITRRNITDYIAANKVDWAGRLDEVAFLKRVYPELDEMPSTDHRFGSASRDIWQHRINNPQDWEDDWVFDDERFDLRSGTDELFIEFLCQMLHPLVQPNGEEVRSLLMDFNEFLAADDWEIVEVSQVSERPVFEGRRREAVKAPVEALELEEYESLEDPQVIREHLQRIDRDLKGDPAAAIGSSKELVESILKLILDDYEIGYAAKDDLMALYKEVQKVLSLRAEAVPDDAKGSQAATKALRALVTTIQSLAELRNALGTGHGKARQSPALTRHARLTFNASIAVSEFLLDTWHERRSEKPM
jgi:hypothetical protein